MKIISLIVVILCILAVIYLEYNTDIILITQLRSMLGIEPFTQMEPIFNNYVTNKSAQRSYEAKSLRPASEPFKKMGTIKTFINDLLDNTIGLNTPEPKCLECEGAINKTVFFKQGQAFLGCKNGVVKLVSRSELTPVDFMRYCCWKIVIGLSGDKNTCSLLHMETDNYLTRLPNNKLILQPAEVVHGSELTRQMATFRLIDSLSNRVDISIMPLPIGKETRVRVLEISSVNNMNEPIIVEYANEFAINYNATSFQCVDTLNEYPVFSNRFTVNGYHKCNDSSQTQDSALTSWIEPMTNYNPMEKLQNTPNRRCNKTGGKRMLAACVEEGELTSHELSKEELFGDIPAPTAVNEFYRPNFDPKTANIFDTHTGAEFNAILNAGVSKKRNELTDNIFYKLENAKLDPNVENLLEYNEARYNIYKNENNDFEKKIYERIKDHTTTVDNLIVDMNNYRVKDMAKDFFFLEDKLVKSRGSNNK